MSLKDQMAEDAKNVFLNTDEMAEEIIYVPLNGTQKTISAVVNRRRLDQTGQDTSRNSVKQAEIWIANDYEDGVLNVIKSGDKVRMPLYQEEGNFIDWLVIEILNKDNGMWHLVVQR